VADVFLCLSEHEGFCVPLQEAMHFGVPVVAYEAGAVRETLRGGGLLLQDKSPQLVAEVLDRLTHGSELRRAVMASQARAVAEIRATDFGALLRDRLAPVLAAGAPLPSAG
jgi:glycosyltransferase involved in cell wall biosynthesis